VRSIPSYSSYLCESKDITIARAVKFFRFLAADGAYVDVDVAQAAAGFANAGARGSALLALSVLEELLPSVRVLPILVPTLKAQDKHIRSKAAGVYAKVCVNLERLKARMTGAEPRVQANIIEALREADLDQTELCKFFLSFVDDADNRVVANALLRLYRLGRADLAKSRLIEMGRHMNATFRASAAWTMGQTGDPEFRASLEGLRSDREGAPRWAALRAMVSISKKLKETGDIATATRPVAPLVQQMTSGGEDAPKGDGEQPATPIILPAGFDLGS
jgi:HEAT repeat protein